MHADPFRHAQRPAAAAMAAHRVEGWRAKVADWVRRYGLAEFAGVCCAFVGSFAARRLTGSNVAAAYGGAWGETLGYSCVIIARDYLAAARSAHAAGRSPGARDAGGVAAGLVTEFGPAAILDTLVVRPFTMAAGMRLLGPRSGLLAGKLVADVVFYLPVIFMYERRKRIARDAKTRP